MAIREYQADGVTVLWDSQRCVHVAACIRALPAVFNPTARPWVRTANATADEIVAAVEACPTGALRYARENGPAEAARVPTSVVPVPNGPLVMRGDLHVLAANGETIAHETRLALCRCGFSENKPFCDNSHRRVEWHSDDPVSRQMREAAESPADIAPSPQPAQFS
jgi:uncharacterized Fe-S cluster protein YjdI/CDGSH-type Zn-finger protein